MSVGPLLGEVVFTFCLAASILYKYGNWKKQNALVTLAVLVAWYFSFLIIFVLPLDVSSTVFRQCVQENVLENTTTGGNGSHPSRCQEPWSNVPDNVLPNLWRVVYWSSQLLTWLVMPLMQSYAKAGEFTWRGRLRSALVDNAIYYGSYLFICIILLVYIALKPGHPLDGQQLKAIASSASNTWGLLLLVGLLGYSLVEVPRGLWRSTTPRHRLSMAYFKAAKISADKCHAEEALDDVLDSIEAVVRCVRPGDELYPSLETVLHKIPLQCQQRGAHHHTSSHHASDHHPPPSLASLVRIHKQLIKGVHTVRRCETQWSNAVEKVILLEDVEANKGNSLSSFTHTFPATPVLVSPTFEWYWRCMVRDQVVRCCAVVAALFSASVVWSELTFFNKSPVLSIFAILLNLTRSTYDYFTIEVLSTVMIAYLCFCAYSTVLKIRVLNYYYLAPHHQTDEHSLIFSGMMLCRLTPPMCLNFLGLIHMDSHIIQSHIMETYYTQVMGHMDVVSIISDGFNIYFPMAVLGFCVATYFSLGSRLLSLVGFQQFLDDDELTSELVDEGRVLVDREKKRRQRLEESAGRRRDYFERFRPDSTLHTSVVRQNSSRDLLSAAQPIATDDIPRRIFDDV